MEQLLIPDDAPATKYISLFDSPDGDGQYDKIIYEIINKFPNNKNYNEILTKAIILDRIYGTNCKYIYELAEDIRKIDIDERLKNGDLSLVHDIAMAHKNTKNVYCYSFATKYCSFHNSSFPIFDNVVGEMLWQYKKKDNFSKFKKNELRIYDRYISILNDFKIYYGLNNLDYKNLDKFLWQYGKEYLRLV